MHHMKTINGTNEPDSSGSIRASVSFPVNYYQEIERIANDKRVSVAWVVREAVIEYLSQKKGDINEKR